MEDFKELWNNQPNIVFGVGEATEFLLGIYVFLINTYN